MIEIKITSNEVNKRLDKFVKKYLSKAPDSFIYKLFRKKDVKVNKKPKPIDYITQENDVIQIYISKEVLCILQKVIVTDSFHLQRLIILKILPRLLKMYN